MDMAPPKTPDHRKKSANSRHGGMVSFRDCRMLAVAKLVALMTDKVL
ncbi:hypothetical protein [Phyllobacterium phragmitis]|nr:hypothetical protein [Phyllobacterium phragmitis]